MAFLIQVIDPEYKIAKMYLQSTLLTAYEQKNLKPEDEEKRKKHIDERNNLLEQNPGYISLTELARSKPQKSTGYTIQMWLRSSGTVDFLTLWENKHNKKFLAIPVALNSLTPKIWIKETNSIGIVSRQGKNGGTYAHKEIAMHFMCWLSAEMMLNVIEKYLEVMNDEKDN